ncbi:MAG: hypothetical protein V4581_14405 [Bacteroidota bacterium]
MFFKVTTYDPAKHIPKPNIFYIQSKGLNAGRPLREPKRNSWVIETDFVYAYEICSVLHIAKKYEHQFCGSVIPFLRIEDFKSVALPYLKNLSFPMIKELTTLQNIEILQTITQNKLKLVQELKISTAYHLLQKIDSSTA